MVPDAPLLGVIKAFSACIGSRFQSVPIERFKAYSCARAFHDHDPINTWV